MHEYKNTETIALFILEPSSLKSPATNSLIVTSAATCGITDMNAKLLTLMALLSLAVLAAGFPAEDNQPELTDANLVELVKKIVSDSQGMESAMEQKSMCTCKCVWLIAIVTCT